MVFLYRACSRTDELSVCSQYCFTVSCQLLGLSAWGLYRRLSHILPMLRGKLWLGGGGGALAGLAGLRLSELCLKELHFKRLAFSVAFNPKAPKPEP